LPVLAMVRAGDCWAHCFTRVRLNSWPIYVKAKADKTWRFWGLYVHVSKMETLYEAYKMTRRNNGTPGIDGVTFEIIEESGVEAFLEGIRDELVAGTYWPARNRRKEIPKGNGKVRVLGIPTI